MEFKFKPLTTKKDFWYGYRQSTLKVEDVLTDDDQIKKLKEALEIVNDFDDQMWDLYLKHTSENYKIPNPNKE